MSILCMFDRGEHTVNRKKLLPYLYNKLSSNGAFRYILTAKTILLYGTVEFIEVLNNT
jgi:hypothetical protein